LAPRDDPKTNPKKDSGKNYEYFTGNIVFFWGGRMQNTRDKPISLFTAVATFIPGPLFLAQS
jgi:palmitoyltransferase ZDHHC9/14/18